MAWIQCYPSGNYHIGFRFGGRLFKRSLHTKSEREATACRERLQETIRLVESGRIELDVDADIPTFLLSDGKLQTKVKLHSPLSLQSLLDQFFDSIPDGNLEHSTLYTMQIHKGHLLRHFGGKFPIQQLTASDLQEYVNRRSKQPGIRGRKVGANTIKKELVTLRTVWGWAVDTGQFNGAFPRNGVRLPKNVEKPQFQTWQEIERRVEQSQFNEHQQADLWHCLYLTLAEINGLLKHVKEHATQPWVYPMFVMAAHTGARRSELLRSQVCDVEKSVLIIRECKRKRGAYTQRRVPLSSKLQSVLGVWLSNHPGGQYTFCHDGAITRNRSKRDAPVPITRDVAHNQFQRTLEGSKWEKIRGWHCLRHSFISNLASQGIDQRMIDEFVGHTTESMRRRYRHLFPENKAVAIRQVFG